MNADVVTALRENLGDAVSTDPAVLDQARADRSGHIAGGRPLAIVTARSSADVQTTLRIAHRHRIGVVPRGAATGLAGGAIASAGQISLSTLAMNRILEINPTDELAVVEPGVLNGDLNAQLRPHGLWFAPDPASRSISTVGGNIATNAGGLLCAKYGVTREAVLGLKVVLADGRMISTGHRSVKGVTGFDITALMVGSEGLLGVIVEATVRVRRLVPGVVATIAAYFPGITDAAAAASAITASGVRPAVMELMDAAALAAIGSHLGRPLADRGQAYLLVQTDGPGAADEAAAILGIARDFAGDAEVTTDPAQGEALLAVRRAFHPALAAGGTVLIEDVAVPRSALAEMFAAIGDIERRFGVRIPTVAHAGDGNLHPNFVVADGEEVPERVWHAADALFNAALRLGGTLTGEHGVGLLKRRWIRQELGDEQYRLQQAIKRAFDPEGILNPGKVF